MIKFIKGYLKFVHNGSVVLTLTTLAAELLVIVIGDGVLHLPDLLLVAAMAVTAIMTSAASYYIVELRNKTK